MKVTLKLFATLREFGPPGSAKSFGIEVGEGATVRDLVRKAGIPEELPRIVMVNARRLSMESGIADGDTVSLFPAIGGG